MSNQEHAARESEIATSLSKVLSRHGHGFHYAVLRRAEQLSAAGKSRWIFEGTEFPISVRGSTTHIDFILRLRSNEIGSDERRTYLVAECKRADPAKAIWCFLRAPYTWRNNYDYEMVFEEVRYGPPDYVNPATHRLFRRPGSYHLGIELKTNAPGDGISSRPAVNDAATQVLRGVSGLIDHLFNSPRMLFTQAGIARFLPVIFTTAELWTSEAKLNEADLQSGEVSINQVSRVDWLWFTHNRSPELQHSIDRTDRPREIAEALRSEFAQTIAIVGPDGIDAFLSADLDV